MNVIHLTSLDLGLAGLFVLSLAYLSYRQKYAVEKDILVAALRTTLQLILIGVVLKYIFSYASILWIGMLASLMLIMAGREVTARQKRKFKGMDGYFIGITSMFVSSFTLTIFALTVMIQPQPWYKPQYIIPLLGMLLGNTMNGVSLGMNHLTNKIWHEKEVIEQKLMLGMPWPDAVRDINADTFRTSMIPMINAMASAGIVSLPGMMTGQILSGSPPLEAVRYQILIMFLISAGTGFGTMVAIKLSVTKLFDERHRLCLDKIK